MRLVLFIDMDYFFAACEELRHPEFKAIALVVGTSEVSKKERGVVQTCNYEARKYGIHSAMSTAQALKLKPDLVYVAGDDKFYTEMSGKVMDLLKGYGLNMEVISIDEAALDLGDTDYESADKFARDVKSRINIEIGLPCTIGVSTGKIFAKMVCDDSKPNGVGLLKEEDLKSYLKDKRVGKIIGVGNKTEERLNSLGISTISQLAKADPNVLVEKLGSFGKELYLLANGRDISKIIQSTDVLSISRERTLESETKNFDNINDMIRLLSKEVMEDVKKKNLWFKGISVKARYFDFGEKIKNKKLNNFSDSEDFLIVTCIQLMKELVSDKNIRKVGVRVYMLDKKIGQRSL